MGTVSIDRGIGQFDILNDRGSSVISSREDKYNWGGIPSLDMEALGEFAGNGSAGGLCSGSDLKD